MHVRQSGEVENTSITLWQQVLQKISQKHFWCFFSDRSVDHSTSSRRVCMMLQTDIGDSQWDELMQVCDICTTSDCLEHKTDDYQNYSVLYCVTQLCTIMDDHMISSYR